MFKKGCPVLFPQVNLNIGIICKWSFRFLVLIDRATEILKSKSVRSTDDVIDVIRTRVRQSQIVTKTLHFHPKVYQKLIIFLIQSNSNLL